MPNHVTSIVTITGPESDIAQFKAEHLEPKEKGVWFNLETIIPKPESIKKTVSGSPLNEQEQADQIAAFKETGFNDWYSWSLHNWGTKWNSYDGKIKSEEPGKLTFKFETAWSFPEPIFDKLIERYPTLQFYCACFDGGWAFAGKGVYGKDFETSQELTTNELYFEVYGRTPESEIEDDE